MSFRGQPCAYCGQPATGRDHVIPRSTARHYQRGYTAELYGPLPEDLLGTVPCCLSCNVNKSTRKLVPPSWESKIPALKEAIPGHWRVWRGSTTESAFSAVYV